MPEITVSMPAYNTGKFIGKAIDSVLIQQGVDFELYVVDDGSTDNTVEVVSSYNDPRVKLFENDKNRGISYCHNLVIKQSSSPYIIHVDSDDKLADKMAFLKMVEKIKESPEIGQVHCYFFPIDEQDKVTREAFHRIWFKFTRDRKEGMDYRRELLLRGSVINHLRTYRREVFEEVGEFNEQLRIGEDLEMALRLLDQYEIKLVPEFLYCLRSRQDSSTSSIKFSRLYYWYERLQIVRNLIRENKAGYLGLSQYDPKKLLGQGLIRSLNLHNLLSKKRLNKEIKKSFNFLSTECLGRIKSAVYDVLQKCFHWWPLRMSTESPHAESVDNIAYYIWKYPILSETFIQREVLALKKMGMNLTIYADEHDKKKFLDKDSLELINTTNYIKPVKRKELKKYKFQFLLKSPLRYINTFLYIAFRNYGPNKSFKQDGYLFNSVIYLAGILNRDNIDHLHTTWSDRTAFTALLVSNLLGISYSTHARAYEIHRYGSKYELEEKIKYAKFALTSSEHNSSYLVSMLNNNYASKIHSVYESIDTSSFNPHSKSTNSKEISILSVGRLVGQKGFEYLLDACRIIKEKNYKFKCTIVGGEALPRYKSYSLKLKVLTKLYELDKHVEFVGSKPFNSTLEYFSEADIFTLPCVVTKDGNRDNIPNSLIEAMAMELPVVSSDVSAISELIDNGENGLIVPSADSEALANAIIKLAQDKELRKKLSKNARIKVQSRFDINENIKIINRLLNSA